MAVRTLDVSNFLNPDQLATTIANYWSEWNSYRAAWLDQKQELRNYLFATDTKTTSNNKLPWSNSTTVPKLTQIRENLHANLYAALFPNSNWLRWIGNNAQADSEVTRHKVSSYMKGKLRQQGFEDVVSKQLYDYIDWGMVIGKVGFTAEMYQHPSGETILGYIGPTLSRISPYDLVLNPVAPTYRESPKIIKEIVTIGDLVRRVKDDPSDIKLAETVAKLQANRSYISTVSEATLRKADGYIADGFASLQSYYKSGFCELLTFYGDLYDSESGVLYDNAIIRIVDRAYVVSVDKNPSWLGRDPIHIAGWRPRPDNLYPMGPLDNLVGLQYRMDHLENLRADVFDQIALPALKIRGDVEDFEFGPGARIYLGDEGDVEFLRPEATALQADLQINLLEQRMEDMAGAPRQALGIRTPGEKTAFEVRTLENNSGRIFQHKTAQLEREFIEPVVNSMLEAARRNLNIADTIRVSDETTGISFFTNITPEDLASSGKLVPMGARHFAERALRVQNLQTAMIFKQIPDVGVHLSGKTIARIVADELNEPEMFGENIAVAEQQETARFVDESQTQLQLEASIAAEEGVF